MRSTDATVHLALTDDQFARLVEIPGRIRAYGYWLGDPAELWAEFGSILATGLQAPLTPELQARIDGTLTRLTTELDQAIKLEELAAQ